jgi:membrane-associated protease RseP (regulator of RpoE activity)
MRRALLLSVLLTTAALAAETKPAETKPAESKPTEVKPADVKSGDKATAPKPFLGLRFDESAVSLDKEPGMPISEVVTGSTSQSLGLEAGDRLLTLDGKATERTDDLSVILAGAKVGDAVSIEYVRAGAKALAQGVLAERPKPATIAKDVDRLNQKLAEVRELAEAQKREPSLTEILQQLKDIEAGLPRAVAAFKKQFPDGEFDIRLQVVITSDKHAKNPVEFTNQSTKSDDKKSDDQKSAPEKAAEPAKPAAK